MIVDGSGRKRRLLSYCTNVHPGETVREIVRDLEQFAVPVRDNCAAGGPFALGLRLGEVAVDELISDQRVLEKFREFLSDERFLPYTLNVFPQRTFHAPVVKEAVYLPDWADPARARYTMRAAHVLASLLPDEDPFGTMSTVPLGWCDEKTPASTSALRSAGARAIAEVAADLARLEARTGRRIQLCLEPEPLCVLETVAETIAWFEEHLWPLAPRLDPVGGLGGEGVLRRHVGVCYDTCHVAVEYEDHEEAWEALRSSGGAVGKIQLSCALEVDRPKENPEGLRLLDGFDEPRFLHQVVARGDDRSHHRFSDLPLFRQWLAQDSPAVESARCHFHVPIHMEGRGPLGTTQRLLRAALDDQRHAPSVRHLEVETYTFSLLPGEFGATSSLVDDLTQEVRYAALGLTGR